MPERLLAGRKLLPAARHGTRGLFGIRQIRHELRFHFLRRIHARIVEHFLVHELGGRGVAVRIVHEVRDGGDHLRTQHVVDEHVRVLRMRCVLRDQVAVEPDDRPFLRDDVLDLVARLVLLGAVTGLEQVAVVPDGEADFAIRQVGNHALGIGITDVRPQRHEGIGGRFQVFGRLAVRVFAQSGQRHAVHLGRGVEHGDATLLEVLHHVRVEDQLPAVDGRVFHRLVDLLDVVANARGAPHVQHRVVVVRIVHGEAGLDVRIHVLQVRQLALVELLVDAGLDLALVGRGRGHHDVVARIARGELRFDLFVAAVVGDGDLDAGLLFEVRDGVFGEVVVPDEEVQDLLFSGGLRGGAIRWCILLLAARRQCGGDRESDQ